MNFFSSYKLIVIFFLITTITSTVISSATNIEQNVAEYLYKFGYIYSNNNDTSLSMSMLNESVIRDGLRIFQQHWNLPVADGQLNADTLNLMNTKRCGIEDTVLFSYKLSTYKWNQTTLNWYFHMATTAQIKIAEKAFNAWSSVSGLNFIKINSRYNAHIIITFSGEYHQFVMNNELVCNYQLKDNILAHAYPPDRRNYVKEIHLRKNLEWDTNLDTPDEEKISLYWVLLHEIGHTLGLDHSDVKSSIMYPFYQTFNINDEPLSRDDINAINYLYKEKKQHMSINSENINTTRIDEGSGGGGGGGLDQKEININHLCNSSSKIKPKNLKFFIFKKQLFIFFQKWVLSVSLDKKKKSENFKLISNYLTFLPKNFTSISTIYERPSGEIALFSDNNIYMFNPNSLKLYNGWPKSYQETFGSHISYNGIQSAILTNNGKTYIVYDNIYVMDVDECSFQPRSYMLFMDLFKGVSIHGQQKKKKKESSVSLLKYTNGKIYILLENRYYEYDEFNEIITNYGRFDDLSLFGIDCPIEGVATKLKSLLTKFFHYYNDADGEGDGDDDGDGGDDDDDDDDDHDGRNLILKENDDSKFHSLNELKEYAYGLFS